MLDLNHKPKSNTNTKAIRLTWLCVSWIKLRACPFRWWSFADASVNTKMKERGRERLRAKLIPPIDISGQSPPPWTSSASSTAFSNVVWSAVKLVSAISVNTKKKKKKKKKKMRTQWSLRQGTGLTCRSQTSPEWQKNRWKWSSWLIDLVRCV